MRINWQKGEYGYWTAAIGDITLCASPDRVRYGKPARGTKWRASVSIWDEPTRTLSRHGRDVYMQLCDSAKEAMRLAEVVYNEQHK